MTKVSIELTRRPKNSNIGNGPGDLIQCKVESYQRLKK